MEQLLAHLVGDYVLQTDKQAVNKAQSWKFALIHAFTYTLPFLLITRHPPAILTIWLSHALIDRYRLAKYLIIAKNSIDDFGGVLAGKFNTPTGYRADAPIWLTTWLFIIADNTMHLVINYAAIKWL